MTHVTKMADSLLWLKYNILVNVFILCPVWTLANVPPMSTFNSSDGTMNINIIKDSLHYVVCKWDIHNQSWSSSFIISRSDAFALGRAVHSTKGKLALLPSPSTCRLNYTSLHRVDRRDFNTCTVDCSALSPTQRVYSFTDDRRQSIFDNLSTVRRQWNVILKGIASIISKENWKTIISFTPSYDELSVIYSRIQSSSSKLLLFTMEKDIHLNQTLDKLYRLLEKEDLNFIIVCSVSCIVEFFIQVYQYENAIGKTSNAWLVIITEGSAQDIVSGSMQDSNADIVVMDPELPACTEEHSSSVFPRNSIVSAKVYTLHSSQDDKKFQLVGSLDDAGSLSVSVDLFPGFKYGLKNRTLTVSTLEWAPFVIKQKVNGSLSYTGVCMDILQELARSLNFSYKIVEPEDGEWGRVLDGRWTGLIGDLAYKKVDLVAAPIAIMESRETVMDSTVPYFFVQASIILKYPDGNANKWMTLVTPFRYEVHVCIFISLIFSTLFLFVVNEMHPLNSWTDNRLVTRITRFGDILWYHFGAVFKNGGSYLPTTVSSRCILSCWWLFTVISAAIYSGNLIAFLTDFREEKPFSSLGEMVEQNVYKWGTLGGSSYITFFQSSNQTVFKKIWQGLQTEPDLTSLDLKLHERKVLEGQYAYIGDETLMELWHSEHCELRQLMDPFHFMNYAFGLPNNSAFTNLFSTQMLRINELGLPREWYKRRSSYAQCDASRSAKRVDLLAMQSAFYAAGVGMLLAIAILMAEIMCSCKCAQSTSSSKDVKVNEETRLGCLTNSRDK